MAFTYNFELDNFQKQVCVDTSLCLHINFIFPASVQTQLIKLLGNFKIRRTF